MRECTRCSAVEQEDSLGAALTHYVCQYCRKDGLKEFGYSREEMEPNSEPVEFKKTIEVDESLN